MPRTNAARPVSAVRPDRRGMLKVGMLGSLGLTLADILRFQAQARPTSPARQRPTSVIVLHMRGGPSQLETFDMKPDAPAEFRGEVSPVATRVPGIRICELLPLTAGVMDKFSVVRSLSHPPEYGDVSHSRGDQVVFTGYPPGANEGENVHPSVGAVAARQLQPLDPAMPAYVMVPRMIPGTGPAYLGRGCTPFETGADPAAKGPFRVPNLGAIGGVSADLIDDRRQLLGSFDTIRRDVDRGGTFDAMDEYRKQAWEMVTGPRARRAFDLDAEPLAVRERYGFPGRYEPRMRAGGDNPGWNQRVLLARRLVEAGVRLVTVDLRWWDTHDDNFWALRNGFLPPFDRCFSALISDLDQRGLLDTTMVVAWGEHGRTPRVNGTAGRDHWMTAFCAAMAGGGIRGGRTVGATDSKAATPRENPKAPQDVLATIYRHLGVDAARNYLDLTGRPHPVLPFGKPIDELF